MKQSSSTTFAVCGSSSLTQAPDVPCRANLKIDPASGKRRLVRRHARQPLPHPDRVGQVLAVHLVRAAACNRTGRAATARRS